MSNGQGVKFLFPLGQIVGTPGADRLMRSQGVNPYEIITRHASGDWGTIGTLDQVREALKESPDLETDLRDRGPFGIPEETRLHDAFMNWIAVTVDQGARVFSVYDVNGSTLWVITDRDGADGSDNVTTFLLPEEY